MEMADISTAFTPETAVEKLVSLANERGGRDNVTVILTAMEPGDTL